MTFSVKARRLLQRLWATGITWDEELPTDIQGEAENWFRQLKLLDQVKFPRRIVDGEPTGLHVFADASDYAYGFAVYLQTETDPYKALEGAHAIAVLTEWDEFKTCDWQRIYNNMQKPAFVFDGRNLLDRDKLVAIGFAYNSVG